MHFKITLNIVLNTDKPSNTVTTSIETSGEVSVVDCEHLIAKEFVFYNIFCNLLLYRASCVIRDNDKTSTTCCRYFTVRMPSSKAI